MAHEAGHHLDYKWGPVVFSTTTVSSSTKFGSLLDHDIWLLNNKWTGAMTAAKRPPCGTGGALVNLYDPTYEDPVTHVFGRYVCNGSTLLSAYQVNGAQTENFAVFTYIYDQMVSGGQPVKPEFFAVSYSVTSGNKASFSQAWGSPSRMVDGFACINALTSSLRLRSAEPPTGYNNDCTRSLPSVPWP